MAIMMKDLVIGIRAEVAQALAAIRQEVVTGARLVSDDAARRSTAGTRLAESLHVSEKEALGREFLKAANHELGLRLDYVEKLHVQLSDQIQGQGDSIEKLLQLVSAQVVELQDSTRNLEARVEQTESSRVEDAKAARMEAKSEAQELIAAVQSTRENEEALSSALSEQFRSDLSQCQTQLLAALTSTTTELNDRLDNAAQRLAASISGFEQEATQWQTQADGHFSRLQLHVATLSSESDSKLNNQQDTLDNLQKTMSSQIVRVSKQTSGETRAVVGELARIQKALNVDYMLVRPPAPQIDDDNLSVSTSQSGWNTMPLTNRKNAWHATERKSLKMAEQTDPSPSPSPSGNRSNRQKTGGVSRTQLVTAFKLQMDGQKDKELDDLADGEWLSSGIRLRDMHTQTETVLKLTDTWAQTDPVSLDGHKSHASKKRAAPKKEEMEEQQKKAAAFRGADKLKKQAKEASMKPPYNVFDYYHDTGWAQKIAKSSRFDNVSLFMVCVNAIWIAVDTDLNKVDVPHRADPVFQIAENSFCVFFTWEIVVRFCAFKSKRDCLRDAWFVFDMTLVILMIIETWILTLVLFAIGADQGLPGGASVLRMVRLLRLLRLTRMTRLLRAVPELMIILRGLAFASRSVSVFIILWVMIIYVCAVLIRQLTNESQVGDAFFSTVPSSMNTLLLNGLFAQSANFINSATDMNPWMWPLLVPFMVLVSITIMYMLVGVLVDVIGAVAASEKERLTVTFIAAQLREELTKMHRSPDGSFTQSEFNDIMTEPGIIRIAQEFGVDVSAMADMLDLIYEDIAKSNNGIIQFPDLVDILLNMRGTNHATVKDCKETIRVTKTLVKKYIGELGEELTTQLSKIRSEILEGMYDRDAMYDRDTEGYDIEDE